jgi:hypothetical protein
MSGHVDVTGEGKFTICNLYCSECVLMDSHLLDRCYNGVRRASCCTVVSLPRNLIRRFPFGEDERTVVSCVSLTLFLSFVLLLQPPLKLPVLAL